MATSVIEDARATAEEVDLLERSLTSLLIKLDNSTKTHRDKLATQHRASDLLNRITTRSASLRTALDPNSLDRNNEIEALTGGGQPGGDLTEFYSRLAKVKDYHRKYPDTGAGGVQQEVDFAGLEGGDEDWLDKRFTGEEGLGRYLDLHELHDKWNNLAPVSASGQASAGGWRRLSYLQYLATCTDFKLSLSIKAKPEYSKYLTQLLAYLSGFYEKVFPLGDLDGVLREADASFAGAWEAGQVTGWAGEDDAGAEDKKEGEGIWCSACQKSFAKETVFNAHLTGKKHVNAAAKLSSADSSATTAGPSSASASASLSALRHQKNRALALKEALISALLAPPAGPLSSLLSDTRDNTERRAALTDKERAAEIEELEAREAAEAAAAAQASKAKSGEIEDDEDEDKIYNPLKLPLGWDGKPIPFWLYKLHGLGVEYRCEICSDFVYMGRKVFEKHFQESRHAFGMRALGLPNTKHFHEITKIEDAIALAEKLKQEGKQEMAAASTTEEVEDDEGNVYDKKTYDDLKRQGLI